MNALTLDDFRAKLQGVKGNTARCPAHDDHNNSFTFDKGDKGGIVFTCHAGCSYSDILAAMGLVDADVMPGSDPQHDFAPRKREQRRHEYPGGYKVIFAGKGAAWYHFEDGKAVKGKPQGITVYNPDALQGDPVYIAEGEKDVDTLTRLGKSAVCGSNGAGPGKWPKEVNHRFKGKYVVVLGDNDDVGRAFAIETANNLHGIAKTVKLVDLTDIWPDMPEKADITDYIEAGGDMVKVDAHADQLPDYRPGDADDSFTPLETFSAVELMGWNLGEIVYLVTDFLHQGLAILAADPKTGKSWWALDLCLCVASGQPFLDFETIQGGTLYLALEDSKRRLQGRMRKLIKAIGIDPPAAFYLATAASPVDQGLSNQIDAHIKAHPGTKLVVIDVLNRVRSTKRTAKQTAYEIDSAEFANIKAIADRHNICILLVHHTRKGKDSSDVFQNISGSQGIIGGVDEGFMLTKANRMDERATLSIISREMGDKEMVLTFDKEACRWRYVGSAEEEEERQAFKEYDTDPVTIAVRGMMKDNPWGFTTKAGEFEINMVQYAGVYTPKNKIGEKFRRYASYFLSHDSIKVEVPPTSSSNKTYKFTHLHRRQTSLTDVTDLTDTTDATDLTDAEEPP